MHKKGNAVSLAIPKIPLTPYTANGRKRPLGLPSCEDNLVQGVMVGIPNKVYVPIFLDCSYGFRTNKNTHYAIGQVNERIMFKKVNYILDCDIKEFFDNVDQAWLMKFLEHDIADKIFLRYIVRFLKAVVMEANHYKKFQYRNAVGWTYIASADKYLLAL